jgi:hypothetical protein
MCAYALLLRFLAFLTGKKHFSRSRERRGEAPQRREKGGAKRSHEGEAKRSRLQTREAQSGDFFL